MDKKDVFDIYLRLLQQVVAARGGDSAAVAAEYAWPAASDDEADAPRAAVSLAPLLTGGQEATTPGATPSGVVPVPPGLVPPPKS